MNLLNKISKPLFIINPKANEKRAPEKWNGVKFLLDHYNIKYDLKYTASKKECVDLVRKDKKHKTIIVLSGDGGVNSLVEGAMKNDLEKVLGVIPAGTANDIARIFDIYSNSQKFYDALLNESSVKVDIGQINKNYFLAHTSLGFDALTLKERDKRNFFKGKFAYFTAGLRALFKYVSHKIKIKLNNREMDKTVFCMVVSNIKYYADGMNMAPFAKPDDGLLDLCLIEGESNPGIFLRNLPLVYSGSHIDNPEVHYEQSNKLEILSSQPLLAQADGDLIEQEYYFKVGIADRKLNMLCVANYIPL